MSGKLKEFAKDSIIYGAGQAAGKLGGLLLVPILSRIFLPGDYGIIDLLNLSFLFLITVINLNIDTGVQKFYYLREGEARKVLVSSTMAFRFALSSSIAIAFALLSETISVRAFGTADHWKEISILALVLPLADLQSQLMFLLRLNRRAAAFSLYNLSQVLLQPILTYLFVVTLGRGIAGVFLAQLATISLVLVPLFLQQRDCYSRSIDPHEVFFIMKYSLPGLPAILQGNLMGLLPRYLLAAFGGLAAVGLYAIADKVANSIQMLRMSFNNAWNPFAFSNAGKVDEKYLYEHIFRLFSLCLLFILAAMIFFAPEIVSVLTPSRYHGAAALIGGIAFYYAAQALTLIFSTALYSVNKVAQTSWMATVLLLVFLASALLLVPAHGSAGLVLSLDIAGIAYMAVYGWTVKRHFPFRFSSARLLPMVGLVLLSEAFLRYVSPELSIRTGIGVLPQKLLLLSALAVASYFTVLETGEKASIKRGLNAWIFSSSPSGSGITKGSSGN